MKIITFFTFIFLLNANTYSFADNKNCKEFKKFSVEYLKCKGNLIKDISIPLNKMEEFFNTARKEIKKINSKIILHPFGHIGDGNIHYNMILPSKNSHDLYESLRDQIYYYINNLVEELGGSFSAEHGIGQIKKKSLLKFKSKNEINLMKSLKKIFDPRNILNPGKIFDL